MNFCLNQVIMLNSIVIKFQVKCFSRSLESFRTAIVVGGTNIADQVCVLLVLFFSGWLNSQ